MNIILVGATGYLGSKLLKNLLEDNNNNVLSLVRNPNNINNYILINDPKLYEKINIFNPDMLIYTSCVYDNGINNYMDILKANFIFPLELMNKIKLKTFIYIGTSINKYTNQYSLSKNQLAEYGKYYSIHNNINFINILLETFYGKNEPQNRFLSTIINKLKNNEEINLTEGNQIRDFIYIEDVINGINIIIKSNLKGYYDIPLGSGEGISIKELLEYLKTALNSKSNLNFGVIPLRKNEHSGFADITKMKELGFDIKLGIKESILRYML
ncbi:NAD(P)-dependent oxidoreductase [uncultured Brachyspira sp.]|uniref:NAD-dependent epimerase/dehydratase family protein n=1 Tax=uncultured Brachyspira sp. TaxID=221953 RepID=UPI00258A121A|nr:NAD(P)-dependent oxidoreductase [uncultured Brachyspira sp.]